MQQQNDIFSKIIALKTVILGALVGLLVIYAIIGIIMIFSSSSDLLYSITKILAPLGIIGVAAVLSVDCFYKMTNSEKIVRMFGLITLILGVLVALFLTLMIWGAIPMYEAATMSGYYSSFYTVSTPTFMYKLTMALLSVTGFTFLGSIVLGVKNNHNLVKLFKYVATGFLAISSLISVIGNFVDFSQDALGSTRITLLQIVSWITALCLGAAVFYLSKTTSWEEKNSDGTSSGLKTPIEPIKPAPYEPATVEIATTETITIEPNDPVAPVVPEPLNPEPLNPEPLVEQPLVGQPPVVENPMDKVVAAEPKAFGHIIKPTGGKE